MSDLAVNVTWQEILRETEAGNIPHTRAIAAPTKWHEEIIESLARIILGSYRRSHPDLIIIGSTDKAPDTDTCRGLINDIALKPLESSKRLGVIMNAGKLNPNAANSLLKLSEEPPEHAYILFLMDDAKFFLGTLKSRSRFSVLISNEEQEYSKPPANESEWVQWLSGKRDNESISSNLEAWTNYAIKTKNFVLADRIYGLKLINDKKTLSPAMMSDMIILKLREGSTEIEDIFNDIW